MPTSSLSKSAIQRLIEAEARRLGVDPRLALAVATQESYLNPNAVGDRGKSLGLFQLQPAAALDAGIAPERRGELHQNIRGGVTYLKQKLAQSRGNVEQALSRYNRGTPTYRGIGDPRYVENVMGHYRKLESLEDGGPEPARGPLPRTPARDWVTLLGLTPVRGTTAQPAAPRAAPSWLERLGLQPRQAPPVPPPAAPRQPLTPPPPPPSPQGAGPAAGVSGWLERLGLAPREAWAAPPQAQEWATRVFGPEAAG